MTNEKYMQVFALNFKEKNVKKRDLKKGGDSLDLSHLLSEDENYVNSLFLEAERFIDLLQMGSITFGKLLPRDKNVLALYFYFTNPVFYRIIELHVRLPLSSLTLQKPKIDNSLIQDYVYNYYMKFLNNIHWKDLLYKMVVFYWLFSESLLLCEDDWKHDCEVDIDEDALVEMNRKIKKEDRKVIDAIVEKYNVDGENGITHKELHQVIKNFVMNYNPNYKGLKSARVLDPFKVVEVDFNDEVDINVYTYPKSVYITKYLNEHAYGDGLPESEENKKQIYKDLMDFGYTRSFIKLNLDVKNEPNLNIGNDPYDKDGLYIAELGTWNVCGTRASMVSAVLFDLVRYFMTCRALDNRVKLATKKVIVGSVDNDIAEDQLTLFESRVQEAIDANEGAFIALNYGFNPQEVRFDVRDDLNLEDIREASRQHILVGTGTPEALITADETYGSSFLKLEVLNLEFLSFRENLSSFLEDYVLKPVAMKRGFVTVDLFGNLKPLYPVINFEVGSIVGQTEFKDMLRDMTAQNMFPTSKLLEYYGFDAEEVFQRMKKDQELAGKMGIMVGAMGMAGGMSPMGTGGDMNQPPQEGGEEGFQGQGYEDMYNPEAQQQMMMQQQQQQQQPAYPEDGEQPGQAQQSSRRRVNAENKSFRNSKSGYKKFTK